MLRVLWLLSRLPCQVLDTSAAFGLRVRAAGRRLPQPAGRRAATGTAALLAVAAPLAMLAPAAQGARTGRGDPAAWAGPARVSSEQQWDGHLRVAARAAARVYAAQAAAMARAVDGAAKVPAALAAEAAERQAELAREAAAQAAAAAASDQAAQAAQPPSQPPPAPAATQPAPAQGPGVLSPGQVGAYWLSAGGPAWAEGAAESVAMCESGDNTNAYNPSGATGLFQILGQVVAGNLYDPLVNALNAVSKFKASGDTWAQWVCQP